MTRLGFEQMRRAFDAMAPRLRSDNVLMMAYSINPDFVEKGWVLPALEEMCKETDDIDPEHAPVDYHSKFFSEVSIDPKSIAFLVSNDELRAARLLAIRRLYTYDVDPYSILDIPRFYSKFMDEFSINKNLQEDVSALIGSKDTARLIKAHGHDDYHIKFQLSRLSPTLVKALSLRERAVFEKAAIHKLLERVRAQIKSREQSFEGVFQLS